MIDLESANKILNLFGKRLRAMPVEEAAEAIVSDTRGGDIVITPEPDDYTDLVLAFIRTRMTNVSA